MTKFKVHYKGICASDLISCMQITNKKVNSQILILRMQQALKTVYLPAGMAFYVLYFKPMLRIAFLSNLSMFQNQFFALIFGPLVISEKQKLFYSSEADGPI